MFFDLKRDFHFTSKCRNACVILKLYQYICIIPVNYITGKYLEDCFIHSVHTFDLFDCRSTRGSQKWCPAEDTLLNVIKTFRCRLSRSLLIEQDQRHFHCCVQFDFRTYGTWEIYFTFKMSSIYFFKHCVLRNALYNFIYLSLCIMDIYLAMVDNIIFDWEHHYFLE